MDGSDDRNPVEALAEEFLERQRGGERPSVSEYVRRYPEMGDEIRDLFPTLKLMETFKPVSGDLSGDVDATIDHRQTDPLRKIGDYRLLREIGRGGMGVVYEAEQESLGRRVALKVLPRSAADDARSLARFQREARAAARMHHTNIVPVFEVGQDEEHVYYTMQLIQGQGLDRVIGDLCNLRSESTRKTNEPDKEAGGIHSLACSLENGRFENKDLLEQEPLVASETSGPSSASGLDKTVTQQSGSTGSAVLPGQSELSTVESNRGAYYRSVSEIGYQTARALGYAHARGIVHRDIKPSNLILDTTGVVWVTDFGLAKTGDIGMTHTGDILGTIRYMSPERFKGQCDVRADIYSLGLTLYELLVLKPAFESPDRLKLIELVASSEAAKPRSIDPRIPRDLETIVLKAIDKEPKRRYQSADDLADDLRRFINDEAILARRVSLGERFVRWGRRNRSLAASLVSIATLMLVLLVGSFAAALNFRGEKERQRRLVVQKTELATRNEELARSLKGMVAEKVDEARRANAARAEADLARRQVVEEQAITRRNLYQAQINMAQLAFDAGDGARSADLLSNWNTTDDAKALRGWEWYYLISQGSSGDNRIASEGRGTVRWNHDGTRLAHAGMNGISIWDPRSNRVVRTLIVQSNSIDAMEWSRDGRLAAADADRGTIRIWDGQSGEQVAVLTGHRRGVVGLDWSPDSRFLASASLDGTARVWDTTNNKQISYFSAGAEKIFDVAWHPDGSQIASVGSDPNVNVWDPMTGKFISALHGHGALVTSIDWHPDGQMIATGARAGEVFLWTIGEEKPTMVSGHRRDCGFAQVAFNGDGSLLASSATDALIRIYSLSEQKTVATINHLSVTPLALDWHPEQSIITGATTNDIRLYRVDDQELDGSFQTFKQPVVALDYSSDSQRMLAASYNGEIRICDPDSGEVMEELGGHEEEMSLLLTASFSPDGRYVAAAGHPNIVFVWDARTGTLIQRLHDSELSSKSPWQIRTLAWSADSRTIAACITDSVTQLWDVHSGNKKLSLPVQSRHPSAIAFAPPPNNQILVTANHGGWVHLWDIERAELLDQFHENVNWMSADFSTTGGQLAVGGSANSNPLRGAGLARVWEFPNAEPRSLECDSIRLGGAVGDIVDVSISPNGRRLSTAGEDGAIRIWDITSMQHGSRINRELMQSNRHRGVAQSVAFAPDGARLISGGADNQVHVFDASAGFKSELSPQLLDSIDRRIGIGAAQPEDYHLRAKILMSQAKWSAAAESLTRLAEFTEQPDWFESPKWRADKFVGGDASFEFPQQLISDVRDGDLLEPVALKSTVEGPMSFSWQVAESANDVAGLFSRDFEGSRPEGNVSRYTIARIFSVKRQSIAAIWRSPCAFCVWQNGKVIHEDDSQDFSTSTVTLDLEKGWNTFLVRSTSDDGPVGTLVRFSENPFDLMESYSRSGEYIEALKWTDQALTLYPDDLSLHMERAKLTWKCRMESQSKAELDSALKLPLPELTVRKARAKTLEELDRIDEAIKEYDRILEIDPDDLSTRFSRGHWQIRNGNIAAGEPDLTHIYRLNPNDHWNAYCLTSVYPMLGKMEEYENLRRELLDKWRDSSSYVILGRTSKACMLGPVDGEVLEQAHLLGMKVGSAQPGQGYYGWWQLAKALAQFRKGQSLMKTSRTRAIEEYNRALQTFRGTPPGVADRANVHCVIDACRAIIYNDLGDPAKSDRALKSMAIPYQAVPKVGPGLGTHWHDNFIAHLFVGEAYQTVYREADEELRLAAELSRSNQIDRADDNIARACELTKTNPAALCHLLRRHVDTPNQNGRASHLGNEFVKRVYSTAIDHADDDRYFREQRFLWAVSNNRWDIAATDAVELLLEIQEPMAWDFLRPVALLAYCKNTALFDEKVLPKLQSIDCSNIVELERRVTTHLIFPDVTNIDEVPVALLRQRLAEEEQPEWMEPWIHSNMALVAYRLNELAEAKEHLSSLLDATPLDASPVLAVARALPIRAMVFAKEGDLAAARDALDKTVAMLAPLCQRDENGDLLGRSLDLYSRRDDPTFIQHDVLFAESLRHEALALIERIEKTSR